MTCQEFIDSLVKQGYQSSHLPSGKIRFTKDGQSWLYSPLDAIKYGTWFNCQTCNYESI